MTVFDRRKNKHPQHLLVCSHLSEISPEPAQDDHGHGEGDQRGAVAHRVQSLHRHIVHVLKAKNTNSNVFLTWNV